MKLLIVAATSFELAPLIAFLEKEATKKSFFEYEYLGNSIFPLVTGVGSMQTAFGLSRFNEIKEIDLAINIGICGAYDRTIALGTVLNITKDRFGDLGVEEADKSFTDVYEMELVNGDKFPYADGWIINKLKDKYNPDYLEANAITVNRVNGSEGSIKTVEEKYHPQCESMEGAAFFYACKVMDVECIQLRAVSNYVEPRNRANWQIEKALDNLNSSLIHYIKDLGVL